MLLTDVATEHGYATSQRGGWAPSFMSYAGAISACTAGKEHSHAIRCIATLR